MPPSLVAGSPQEPLAEVEKIELISQLRISFHLSTRFGTHGKAGS